MSLPAFLEHVRVLAYLRLLDVPVPAVCGVSADENPLA
jgi:hypothetical protein